MAGPTSRADDPSRRMDEADAYTTMLTRTRETTTMRTIMKTWAGAALTGVLALGAPASAAAAAGTGWSGGARATPAPATGAAAALAWMQEDPAARAYQAARDLLSRGRFRAAADAFRGLREDHPRSAYGADAFYWEAFALSREGGRSELGRAVALLEEQARAHPDAGTRSDAEALRVRIEGELARRGDARAAGVVARQAQNPCGPEQDVRLAALSALMNMNAEQAIPILRDVLRSRDECSTELRERAVFLVAQNLTDESVDILLDLAHRDPDPDPEVRGQAVFWLHQVRTPEALAALEAILSESDDPELQEQAIFGISQRGRDPRALEILREYATRRDVSAELRGNAIFWIGQNAEAGGADYLIEIYPTLDDPELRENALFAIAQSRSEAARRWLLERVRDPAESMEVRKNALFWAGQTGGVPTADLRTLFRDTADPEMREQIVFVAAQRGATEDIDFLMEVARSAEDPELRENAVFWLGQSDDPRVPEFLRSLLRG